MSQLLEKTLGRVNLIRAKALWLTVIMRLFRAMSLGGTIFFLWAAVQPGQVWTAMGLGLLTFLLAITFQVKTEFRKIVQPDFLVALDMNHPQAKWPPFDLAKASIKESFKKEWEPRLEKEVKEMQTFERSRLLHLMSSLPIPIACLIFASLAQPRAFSTALSKVSHVVARLGDGATLRVISGAPGDSLKKPLDLSSSKTLNIELLMQNMIEIKVVGKPDENPLVDLRKRLPGLKTDGSKASYQSFRLTPLRRSGDEIRMEYLVAFSVKEDVDLYLSTESSTKPVASVTVRMLPIPKVNLAISGEIKKPWPDDRPLPLRIVVAAENPLKQIRLQIKAEGRSSTEIVSNVLVNDKKNLDTRYDLLLETYVQSDISRVEIIAEAVDRAVPLPLVGQSDPLFIETASAYGRYRQTLTTLNNLRAVVDEAAGQTQSELPPEALELAKKAQEQSKESPFFDGLDRVHIASLANLVGTNMEDPNLGRVFEIQEALNEFLYEHETLDDRERDRDFFVAVRALSRLVEKPKDQRNIEVETVVDRIKNYLEERQKRWALRVKHLDEIPEKWPEIRQKPFQKGLVEIAILDQEDTRESQTKALGKLSKIVTEYRAWIEELERIEQKARESQEKKRREGLASARNKLKELQRRQGQISSRLDKAVERSQEEMADNWPSTRAMQNTNIKGTKGLEAQLRSLSPKSGERVKAALSAMSIAIDSGNGQAFVQSESAADMAGRLLRQAQTAARQSERQKRRKERRRRVTGDSYYGRQIVGGDIEIKREYSVDRRYREEILEEISSSKQKSDSDEEARILEDYLRKVVR